MYAVYTGLDKVKRGEFKSHSEAMALADQFLVTDLVLVRDTGLDEVVYHWVASQMAKLKNAMKIGESFFTEFPD